MLFRSQEVMLKGRCPFCDVVFEFPKKDRVDVVLFDNWRKYHYCEEAKKHDEEKRSRTS